jgi:type VI secretion system protein
MYGKGKEIHMKNYVSRVVLLFAGIVCALALLTNDVSKVSGQTRKLVIKVDISPQANNNNPVLLELVLVKDKKLFKELMKLSASEWFEKRKQYRLDYPKEIGLGAGSWEWVPGQVVKIDPIPFNYKVAGGLVFANYFTPGAHRAVIDPSKPIVLTLGPQDIVVTPDE